MPYNYYNYNQCTNNDNYKFPIIMMDALIINMYQLFLVIIIIVTVLLANKYQINCDSYEYEYVGKYYS